MASAAAAEMAGGGSAPSLDAEALNRRVARRTAAVAAADATSTGAMLLDPDDPDGTDGAGVSGSAASMAADLMRAAEGEAARGIASDPVVASLQTPMRAVVLERAAEAEGNRKVSAATSGRVAFQSLPDGRLVVRYAVPDVGAGRVGVDGERTEIVQDLPAGLLPARPSRRGVGPEQRGAREPRARRDGGGVAPRVLGGRATRRRRRSARTRIRRGAEALAPGAADWAAVATRERRKPNDTPSTCRTESDGGTVVRKHERRNETRGEGTVVRQRERKMKTRGGARHAGGATRPKRSSQR